MNLLKTLSLNLVALIFAGAIGLVAISQVAYMHEIPVGARPIAPWVRAAFVTIIVAAAAPRTGFRARLSVFAGIYLVELALSVVTTAAAIEIVYSYFDGDGEAAKPWTYFGAITPFISGAAGYFTLRQFRRPIARIGP
ncbi:hypothetical protein [Sinorhizobium chiapasense]|uniref:Transmembrane protein n=1 Tax=Sinorhizobium chiapasense TaxID=501572 RepID=A0ABZ2B5T9_9HYPH